MHIYVYIQEPETLRQQTEATRLLDHMLHMAHSDFSHMNSHEAKVNLNAKPYLNRTTRPHATHGAFGFQPYELTRGHVCCKLN